MVGQKWDNVDRTVLQGSLTERNLARICAQKRAFLLPARSQLQKDNSHCHGPVIAATALWLLGKPADAGLDFSPVKWKGHQTRKYAFPAVS